MIILSILSLQSRADVCPQPPIINVLSAIASSDLKPVPLREWFKKSTLDVSKVKLNISYPEPFLFKIEIIQEGKVIGYAQVITENQNEGLGLLLYMASAKKLFEMKGVLLQSNSFMSQLTPKAERVWEGLIRKSYARKIGPNAYQMKREVVQGDFLNPIADALEPKNH